MTDSTISLVKRDSLEPDKQVEEAVIALTNGTKIRVGHDEQSATGNPPVKVNIEGTFHNIEGWSAEHNQGPKIWINHEDGFYKLTCAHSREIGYNEKRIYMINDNEIAYVDIKY